MARNNEVLATKRTDRQRLCACSRRGLRAARAGWRRRMIVASDKGDYAFLNLKAPAFDLSDRGVAGRAGAGRARCVRLHRARRLSLRRDRAGHGAAARCAGRRGARRAADAGGRAAGRRRISPRRWSPIRASADAPGGAAGRLGADRHLARARLHRSQAPAGRRDDASWSRTTCPTASSSISPPPPSAISQAATRRRSRVDGHYLYGAPASDLELDGEVTIAAAKERAGFAGYEFGARRR